MGNKVVLARRWHVLVHIKAKEQIYVVSHIKNMALLCEQCAGAFLMYVLNGAENIGPNVIILKLSFHGNRLAKFIRRGAVVA